MRARFATTLLLLGLCAGAARPAVAKDKDKEKPPPGPPKTGQFQMPAAPPFKYVYMAVPKDYDAKKWYPLLYVLHPMTDNPDSSKPEPYVDAWAKELLPKGWIVASPAAVEYENENTVGPLQDQLRKVMAVYHVDDRRVVLVGHNAGALMAWRLATRAPQPWAGVVALSGEIPSSDRTALKALVGRSVYLFRGGKDSYYTDEMLQADKKFLEFNKITPTVEVKADGGAEFPLTSAPTIAAWIDGVWPAGAYREKAAAVEKALESHDLAAANAALKELQTELKKSPYPAFEARLADYTKSFLDQGRALLEEARKALETDPLGAVERAEAAAKALKGLAPLDAEAAKLLATLKKDPRVVEASRKKEAETAASALMDKAAAAEAKGDLAKALEAYRKAAALDSSRKAEAQQKVAELEPKVGSK